MLNIDASFILLEKDSQPHLEKLKNEETENIAIQWGNLLGRCIFSEIKYCHSENIAVTRLDLVHHIQTGIGKTGKVMRQIAFRYHRHNEFLL